VIWASRGSGMDAFGVLGDYESFVGGFLDIRDPQIPKPAENEGENGLLWPEVRPS